MSITISPVASEASSPMITSVTPTLEPGPDKHDDPELCGPGVSEDRMTQKQDRYSRYQKPPPLHTGADWKVVLHLPEIETWLRATTERVRDLTHSVQQDSINKHVDVHLVQLKDICEDISDHVEQVHALLETEFSLKLLSYSVNIIVDIRSVQLLWHQLRVSVLVLKERLLQGLQDSNGNYTRQTDILQAFNQDHDEARLDTLTEVDDSGQLTIKCSQDYFSLDCGITAFELSDYSPIEDPESRGLRSLYPELEQDFPELLQSVDLLNIAASRQNQVSSSAEEPVSTIPKPEETISGPSIGDNAPATAMQGVSPQSDSNIGLSKRPLQGGFRSDASPTQPLPKKPMYLKGDGETRWPSPLQYQADMSRSTPSLLDPPDRSKFWLELESAYPGNASQSFESLHATNRCNLQIGLKRPSVPGESQIPLERRSSEGFHTHKRSSMNLKASEVKQAYSDSSSPAPSSGEDISDHDTQEMSSSPDDRAPTTSSLCITHRSVLCNTSGSPKERWYGSDEFLALPAQLKKTEMLAMKLESLAQALPQRFPQESIQDVDDWELTEVNHEWESGDDLVLHPYRKPFTAGRFSPTSSSDVAPSVDESIESGRISDLLSENEGARSTPESRGRNVIAGRPGPPKMILQCTPLIEKLVEDIQHQDNYHDVWGKIEGFVSKLDEFIRWLRDALETTENWTPPRADIHSLKLYLETHLSFKLNVDSHSTLKDSLLEEGRHLLELIASHKSGLRDILHMVSCQWQELQRQIRRQHNWMLRTLDAIKTQILFGEGNEEQEANSHHDSPKLEVLQSHREAQKDVLDQMKIKLKSQQYCPNNRCIDFTRMSKSNSLSEFEADYQELWDWLMDMESIVTDSHDLMMSEEQRLHLYKGNSVEMSMWLPKKTQLLGWSESLKRSGVELPADFDHRLSALRSKWDQLEKTLSEHVAPSVGRQSQRDLLSPETNRMVTQLETRIKELKSWLRETELFIFNLNLRPEAEHCEDTDDQQHSKQLQHFKALCMEIRGRRRGVSSVLRLCQKLLDGPERQSSETDRQSLQLVQVNLERRWEAIVMQVLQWQTRLQRTLGQDQVPGNLIEPSLMDLHGQTEDSWEWDEMDMTIGDETQELNAESEMHPDSPTEPTVLSPNDRRSGATFNTMEEEENATSSRVYQVYSLHEVEFYHQPQYQHKSSSTKVQQPLLKSLSVDSSFSSAESLPDILGELLKGNRESARRSESESGIVSEGDTETTGNSEVCLLLQSDDPKVCVTLTPPTVEDSINEDRVSDEVIDRVLERANKCVEYGDSLPIGKRDQRLHMMRKKREECRENRKKHFIDDHSINPDNYNTKDDQRLIIEKKLRKEFAQLSQGSSLDSLYAVGELFPSSKETLTRSTSLESWLSPCKSMEEGGSRESLRDNGSSVESTGELSRRTLELLKRLENIQNPLAQKMTRSVSDVTLQNSWLWRGPRSAGAPSSINESSAASLTELSSTEDSSVASEDLAVQMNRRVAAESNASFRKHCRGQQQNEEGDASISMVVNVSCTSACTDDEEDSDLLSSSTLTLTEEELGIKDDDSSVTSEEEYIEGPFGLDYTKGEFQSWIKPRFSQCREKNEADLVDELQCGTLSKEIPIKTANDRQFLSRSALKLLEADTNAKNESLNQKDVGKDATRSYISRFADDMENGNVESVQSKGKDEDLNEELLREEGSLLTRKGESFKGYYMTDDVNVIKSDTFTTTTPSSCEQLSLNSKELSLDVQLKGELPCHNSRRPSPSISPAEECSWLAAHAHSRQKQLTAFLNDVQENHQECTSDSCGHPVFDSKETKAENVHDFVMEIIDMTSVALKTKETQADQPAEVSSPTSVSLIKEKVLEHSHRFIHLRKGDFYSYLSLSSHDSDCGEVSTCTEDKSTTPILSGTPDIRDEEPLFEACTEEVYLGPPLCYSMSINKRPTRCSAKLPEPLQSSDEYQKAHGISQESVAGSQPEYRNEAPYLNPLPCETQIDTVECFADTKMLESNISPVMTKIRVSCSTTNPLKGESSLYINPKINCPLIRRSDSDERAQASQLMRHKNVGKGHSSLQEVKSTHKQLARSETSSDVALGRRAQISAPQTNSSSAGRVGVSSRPQVKRFSGTLATSVCKP